MFSKYITCSMTGWGGVTTVTPHSISVHLINIIGYNILIFKLLFYKIFNFTLNNKGIIILKICTPENKTPYSLGPM